ncbi:MAG: hypothetical protein J5654_00590 [Victivallales bacterium]|nr:hypothetical protein [Victivallales bacterium]
MTFIVPQEASRSIRTNSNAGLQSRSVPPRQVAILVSNMNAEEKKVRIFVNDHVITRCANMESKVIQMLIQYHVMVASHVEIAPNFIEDPSAFHAVLHGQQVKTPTIAKLIWRVKGKTIFNGFQRNSLRQILEELQVIIKFSEKTGISASHIDTFKTKNLSISPEQWNII